MFERRDTPTIMDGVVVRYQEGQDHRAGEISASRNKVLITGDINIRSRAKLGEVLQTICQAFLQYEHLEPNRVRVFSREEPLDEAVLDRPAAELGLELFMTMAAHRQALEPAIAKRCRQCGARHESTIHHVDSTVDEIRAAAHQFEPWVVVAEGVETK